MNRLQRHDLQHADGRRVYVYGEPPAHGRLAAHGAELQVSNIHRRLDLLTRDWVAISPARNLRPLEETRAEKAGCPAGVLLDSHFLRKHGTDAYDGQPG